MSEVSNFKTGQFFVGCIDKERGIITFTETAPPTAIYSSMEITFRGKTPDQFTEQDKKDFIEETRRQVDALIRSI